MIEEDSRPIDPNLQRMIEDLRKRDSGISEKVLDIFRVVDRKFFINYNQHEQREVDNLRSIMMAAAG